MTLSIRTHILLTALLWSALLLAFPPAANAGQIIGAPIYMGLSSGLVGWWTFDGKDTAGNVTYDRSGRGNHGTLINGPQRAIGKIGQALHFDGVNDYVDIVSNMDVSGSGITIAAWAKPTNMDVDFRIVSKANGSQEEAHVWMLSNCSAATGCAGNNEMRVRFSIGGVINVLFSNSPALRFVPDEWQFVAATYDGDVVRFFRNGVSEVQDADNGTLDTNSDSVHIGEAPVDFGEPFAGLMDDVRVYERALSVDELKRLYKIGSTEKFGAPNSSGSLASGLVGWWTFDGADVAGTDPLRAYDRSGGGNTASSTGTLRPQRTIGKIGQALAFDATNDYMSATDINSTDSASQLSVSAWIYQNALHDDATVVHKWTAANPNWYMALSNSGDEGSDDMCFSVDGNAGTGCTDTDNHEPGRWEHWVAVFDGSQGCDNCKLRIYLNGDEQEGLSFVSTIPETTNTNSAVVQIAEFWDGAIDDLRIYNRALTTDEIKRLYKMGSTLKQGAPNSTGSLSSGLVGWWTMDGNDTSVNGSGLLTALDRSGNGNKATSVTAAETPIKAIGNIGQALDFDGVNDYLNVEAPATLRLTGSMTISAWVKPQRLISGGNSPTISKHQANCGYQMMLNDDVSDFNFSIMICENSSDYVIRYTNTAISTNQWYHVVGVYNAPAQTLDIYLNGTKDNGHLEDLNGGAIATSQFDSSDAIEIGAGSEGGHNLDGIVDDLRVYNRALSADEIKRLYNIGR